MGEEIKILCSETTRNNNGNDLKEIFINRFKLPEEFWNNLFHTNCPEGDEQKICHHTPSNNSVDMVVSIGLGKVNEKLRSNDDLSGSDFKSPDDSLICEDAVDGNNRQNILQVKTPISVVKSVSSVNCSPSLFSPFPQDLELLKGPSSSTPLPGKSVCAATFTLTPKTTKNNAHNDCTSEHKLLDYIPRNTKSKSPKLSASLAMDSLEQMNLSWSSSLATPPVSGSSKQESFNTKNDKSIPEICSSELGENQLDDLDTIRIGNPLEQLSTIKVEGKSKPKSKGVARILFEKEMNNVAPCKNSKVKEVEKLSHTNQFKSVSDDSCHKQLCEVSAADNNSLSHFDMSCLSPLQETVINELFMLADTRKSPKGIKSIGLMRTSDIVAKHVENNVTKHFAPDCFINEHAKESSEIDPNSRNITIENADKDLNRNIDMDALSELPMDFDLSQLITVQSASNQDQTINPENKNVNNSSNALTTKMTLDLVRDEKTDPALKSSVEGAVCLTDNVNKPPGELDNLYDMDALSELPIDFDMSRYITEQILHPDNNDCYNESHFLNNISTSDCNGVKGPDIDGKKICLTGKVTKPPGELDNLYDMDVLSELPSLHSDNNDCNNDFHCFTNKSNNDSDGKCIGQIGTPEGQIGGDEKSKIIQSPRYVEQSALTRKDEGYKTLYVKQNDKLKIVSCLDVEKNQDGKSLNPFLGFSTASGKKVTISDKSIQRARQFLSEVNMREEKFSAVGKTVHGNVLVKRNLADSIGTCQVNKAMEKVVSTGFSTASGKKVEVSIRSLNKARQIVQDVMQEESEESKDLKKSAVASEGVTLALKTKFEVPKLMSNYDKVEEKERDEFTIPELSEDFLKDVDKVFADLDEEPCLSKGDKTQGDMTKVELNKNDGLDIAKHIPSAITECRDQMCGMEMSLNLKYANHELLSVHGKKDVLSDESSNKAPVDSELDGKQSNDAPYNLVKNELEEQQESVTKEYCNEHAANKNLFQLKPNVVSTASDNIKERGEEVVKNTLPDSKTTVVEGCGGITSHDSLHGDKQIINKLCKPNCEETNGLLKIDKKPFHVGTNVTNSEEDLSVKENEDCSEERRKLCNIQNIGFSTLSGNEIVNSETARKPQTVSNEESKEEQSQGKVANDEYNDRRRACLNTNASGSNTIISETVIQPTKMIYDDESEEYSRVAVGTFEFQKRGNENVDLSTSSGETDTVFKTTSANENQGNSRSGNKITNFGFSTASGKKIMVSEDLLKKAQMILNEVENDGRQSKKTVVNEKHSNPCSIACVKNKSAVFTTASGKNVAICEVSVQKARAFLTNKENLDCSREETTASKIPMFGFSTALGKETYVSEESLKKARRILNEVDCERQRTKGEETNEKCKIAFSTTAVEDKPLCFSTVSENSDTVSGLSIQKPNRFVTDKKNDSCSEKGSSFSKNSKFVFSTPAGKEIAVSKQSMKKARRILNEVDNEGYHSFKHSCNPCSSTTKENVGSTIATGNNVTVSEASIQKVKKMFDGKLREKEKSSRAASNFGFSTASGNKIAISEESLKKARKILKEADNEEPKANCKIGKLAVGTSRNTENCQEAENAVDDAKCIGHKVDVKPASTTAQEDISRSGKSVCNKTRSPSKGKTMENGSDNKCQRSHIKRLSSEIETENDRACKASRTGKETKNDGSKWMRFKRFDPFVTYKDRMRSGNPSQVALASPDLVNTNQVTLRDQAVDVKTPINANSKAKPCSHFITPYRVTMMKQGKSSDNTPISRNASTPLSSCLKLGGKKTKSADQEKKDYSVKPQPGSIYKLRTNPCLKSKRLSFAEYVGRVNQQNFHESEIHDVRSSVISISCQNAESYRFEGSDFLSDDIFATNAGVTLTEGAVLFLGEDKCAGLPEVTKAFLSSPGVDPKLISEEWIANHYKWVVWKLASYERSYPQAFSGRVLTPDVVLSQLKYRYDREIDHCERSAIKKILERDDSASRSMVLCVASLNVKAFDKSKQFVNTEDQRKNVQPQKVILMTDNWYEIRVQLDEYLENLVREKKIYVGQKLYTQGAELCGSNQPVSPLEAPTNLYLRIHGNSTRPAKKFSRLGFHCKNNVFLVPVKSISTVGGLVSCINVLVLRQYPLQFMEKLPDGKCIFRNPRCEERVAKKFEDDIQRKREKIIAQVQQEIDEEDTKTTSGRKSNSVSTDQILSLSDGKQIFDAISNDDDPFGVEKCLSDEQRRILHNYKENLQNNRADIVRRRYEKAWSKLSEEETLKRDVVPILKVKLVDCFPPKSNQTPGTALLTVWKPNEQTITTLGEGKRLKIYNLQVSKYKGNNLVQLSANRATIYRAVHASSTGQKPFDARKEFTLREISNGLKPNVEVDVVAVVISQSCQHNLTLVYVADFDLNLLRIKVWGGLESQGLQDVMKEKNFIAACNLLSQPDNRCGIPSVKYYELSLVTSNPSNKKLRNSLYELRKAVPNPDLFTKKAKAKLDELCRSNWSTPKRQNVTPMNGTSSESAGKRRRTTDTLMETGVSAQKLEKTPLSSTITPRQNTSGLLESRKRMLHSKQRKLDLLADPSPISPIPNALPASVRKAFQAPRRIRTEANPDLFTKKAKAKLDELCRSNWSTPKGENVTPMDSTSSESAGKRRRTTDTLMETGVSAQKLEKTPLSSTITPRQNTSGLLESRKRMLHSKRRKLDLLADPSPISPIPNALPASVRKAFQAPRRIRTETDDTENEEE